MRALEHSLWYPLSRAAARLVLGCLCRVHVLHRERSAAPGRWILASDHISHFDPPLLSVAARRIVDWMAMAELFSRPWAAAWLRSVGAFPVNRSRADRATVRTALERLEQGRVIGMFPEGGIRDGERSALGGAPLRTGIGALAQFSGAPVVPCVILGSDRLYRPRRWLPLRGTPIWIAFGEPMFCAGKDRRSRVEFEAAIARKLRDLAGELREAYHLRDEDFPMPPQLRRIGK
jgi:1-acyl-sn-glycerol-3-phosphate acyltransferase